MIQNAGELDQFIRANDHKDGIEWRIQGDRVVFVKEKAD